MKKILVIKLAIILMMLIGCQEDEPGLGNIAVPVDLQVSVEVKEDQSGIVTVTATAENAINIHIVFIPGSDPVVVAPGEPVNFRFTQSGQYTAPITVVAFGAGGISSSTTVEVDLDVRLFIDQETLQLIGGSGTKRWVWNSSEAGHFGVGPLTNDFPEFFSAGPNALNPCLYDDVLVFSYDENDNYTYSLEPGENNEVFINWTEVNRFFPDATPQQFNDECRDITDQASFNSSFVIIDNDDGTRTLNVGDSFLSYWAVISGEFQITELTENRLTVRGISQPFNGDDPLAWYHTFVPEDFDPNAFDSLLWSDEFDTDGAPDAAKWTYDLGDGCPSLCGWGNGESQYYTDRPENVVVENGVLKITAKTESFMGSEYTSARLKTQDLFDFTYGKVEVRAKLPEGGGTWPAIWMLGSNITSVGWPTCGEIDIMEHVGNQQNTVFASLHYPLNSGGGAITDNTVIPDVSQIFHEYSVEWTATKIEFFIDGVLFHSFDNEASLPFNNDFFLLINVAMGGNFGGSIDPAFTESSLEIDYIRVYQ